MIEIGALGAAGAGLAGIGGLAWWYLWQRARIRIEREGSARNIARTRGLTRMACERYITVRLVERDIDGERLVEINLPGHTGERAA
ncbi:hypothetical protein GCM10009557_04190 [Virgisporangium ochraceum]|uniref:Uncharacterized protein n=1 Tax=Virgisporangium ochraceum TaxID=65505 RepID=A0A8J4E8Y1_9ACTN|nr:hypothetical protein [Virgisporangium ochraceum]GIJ65728.1 hypothetical protein Voc01_006450 [Virgisporangium ochraceum]